MTDLMAWNADADLVYYHQKSINEVAEIKITFPGVTATSRPTANFSLPTGLFPLTARSQSSTRFRAPSRPNIAAANGTSKSHRTPGSAAVPNREWALSKLLTEADLERALMAA
jgi:hypothetical protein